MNSFLKSFLARSSSTVAFFKSTFEAARFDSATFNAASTWSCCVLVTSLANSTMRSFSRKMPLAASTFASARLISPRTVASMALSWIRSCAS